MIIRGKANLSRKNIFKEFDVGVNIAEGIFRRQKENQREPPI